MMEQHELKKKNKGGKVILLFLALLLPIGIFLFLKIFGKNEFAVDPLFTTQSAEDSTCFPIRYPYHVPDSIARLYPIENDSLVLILSANDDDESIRQRNRAKDRMADFPVKWHSLDTSAQNKFHWKCVFLMREQKDVVLIDRRGRIRGQYASDREDIDRLITEVTIILKKY